MTETSQTREAVENLIEVLEDRLVRARDIIEEHERTDTSVALKAILADLAEAKEEIKALGDLQNDCANMTLAWVETDAKLSAALAKLEATEDPVRQFITDWFSPWGSWKTAWWEGVVGDHLEMSSENALKALRKIADQATPAAALARAEKAEEVKTAWVLQRNNLPYTVYFDEAEAQGECVRQREADAKWCEKNKHAADVRTYWNVYKTVRAAKPEGLR